MLTIQSTFFTYNMGISDLSVLIAFASTFVITGIIGLERQNIGKAAGISPHVLVSMSACAIAVMQQLMFHNSRELGFGDPEGQRIIAQVIAGIGFLGAGVIMKSDRSIKGLTTATTVWSSAIIGLVLGSGYIALGWLLGGFILVFMITRDLKRHINPFKKQPVSRGTTRPTHVSEYDDSNNA